MIAADGLKYQATKLEPLLQVMGANKVRLTPIRW